MTRCQLCGVSSWRPIPDSFVGYLGIGFHDLHSGQYRQCGECNAVARVDLLHANVVFPPRSSTDPMSVSVIALETLKTLKPREISRAESLLGKLFTAWDLSADVPNQEYKDKYIARRMVQFVRAIEHELDSPTTIESEPIRSPLPSSIDEVALIFRGRIPMSFVNRDTFESFIQNAVRAVFPDECRSIATLVESALFASTRPLVM